jgi:hypothetical protein
MAKFRWICAFAVAATAAIAKPAQAQCTDPWITQAIRELWGRTPSGSGGTGECAIGLYGGGSWSSYTELKNLVMSSKFCGDPWVGEAVYLQYGRRPVGSASVGECNTMLYTGYWTSYPDLKAKVRSSLSGLSSASMRFDASGNMLTPSGTVYRDKIRLGLSNRIVGQDGTSLVPGTGNVVAGGAGNLIQDGGAYYTVMSTGTMIAPGVKFTRAN